jgi:hypothetical protein
MPIAACSYFLNSPSLLLLPLLLLLLLLLLPVVLLLQSLSLGEVAPPPGLSKRHLPSHVDWRGTGADGQVKDQVGQQQLLLGGQGCWLLPQRIGWGCALGLSQIHCSYHCT